MRATPRSRLRRGATSTALAKRLKRRQVSGGGTERSTGLAGGTRPQAFEESNCGSGIGKTSRTRWITIDAVLTSREKWITSDAVLLPREAPLGNLPASGPPTTPALDPAPPLRSHGRPRRREATTDTTYKSRSPNDLCCNVVSPVGDAPARLARRRVQHSRRRGVQHRAA